MACDLALMDVARNEGVGVLRVYEWAVPTVSFGRHERTAGVYSAEALAAAGLSAVRRPTGGRALLHAREVTYSVTLPVDHSLRWTATYDLVNACLLRAMLALDVPARIVGSLAAASGITPAAAPAMDAAGPVCFSGIAQGELAVGDRKLVASSVWRERGAYLQHGSILIHDDQSRLAPFLGGGAPGPAPAAVLAELLPGVPDAELFALVESALNQSFGDCGNAAKWSIPSEVLHDVGVKRTALIEPSWLWRR